MRVVVLAFVERDGMVLMERRSDCGLWGLIGGAVEAGESLEDALRHEVLEETGLQVGSFSLFGTFSDPSMVAQYPDGAVLRPISLAYRVRIGDFGSLRCSPESLEVRFFTRAELRGLEIIPTVRHVVDRYLEGRPEPVLE
jgi:8-oxo-dGTP pyrophosphatase MutT (NUDIX family)